MKTIDELIKVAASGGGIVIGADRPTQDLVRIASYAAKKGSRVIIKGASIKPTRDLEDIAHSGMGP